MRCKQTQVVAYVIMPNHLHILLYFPQPGYALNMLIANAKRFLAYEIIKRLKASNDLTTLLQLQQGVSLREKNKGQRHKVFEESFDAKAIYTQAFFHQKRDYIQYKSYTWQMAAGGRLYYV